jgi:hypothetical protein
VKKSKRCQNKNLQGSIITFLHLAIAVAGFVDILLNDYWNDFIYQQFIFCLILIITCLLDLYFANEMRKAKIMSTESSMATENAQSPTDISVIGLNDAMREKFPPPNFEQSSSPAIIQIPPSYQVILIQ